VSESIQGSAALRLKSKRKKKHQGGWTLVLKPQINVAFEVFKNVV